MYSTEEPEETNVDLIVTINIPGQIYRRVHTQWPVASEPVPHKTVLAKMLADLAEELAE